MQGICILYIPMLFLSVSWEENVNTRMMIPACCTSSKLFPTFLDIITFYTIVWFWELMLPSLKKRSCNLASCLPFHYQRLRNNAFVYPILFPDFPLNKSTYIVPVSRDWSIERCLFTKKFSVIRVYNALFTCHRVSCSCGILFIHEAAGILFFPTGFLMRFQ